LIEKAILLRDGDKVLPRYTYFMLSHAQNRTPNGKLFLDSTTLYEYTWIGDLPYGRVVELQGKPLKGKALADEQARYDKAVADHGGLDVDARAKAKHYYLLDTELRLEPLLTPAYVVSELRLEGLAGSTTHVIDCIPAPSQDSAHPAATRHATLWIMDSGAILRENYEVVADEPDRLHGSHGQADFQLIDGNQLPRHSFFHLNAPNGNTAASTCPPALCLRLTLQASRPVAHRRSASDFARFQGWLVRTDLPPAEARVWTGPKRLRSGMRVSG
jgi:hypothetical protein